MCLRPFAAIAVSLAVSAVAHAAPTKGPMGSSPAGIGAVLALPPVVVPCALTDISPSAAACQGFFDGQRLSGNAGDIAVQTEALLNLGLAWNGTVVQRFSGIQGRQLIDFDNLLVGTSWIGVHYGGGQGSPNPPPKGGGTTAFYRFDAGAGLDTFRLNYKASSDVVLYSTGKSSGDGLGQVPEPASIALVLAALGLAGAAGARRRNGKA